MYSLQMIGPSLYPCLHGIFMPMCLLRTLLQIQHAYGLEYDKPWLIQHYIQIFNMIIFSCSSEYATHFHFLWDFRNRYGFFADSKYVNFNKNTYFFSIFFLYIFCHHSSTQKRHCLCFIHISFISQPFKKKLYGALKNTDLYKL